MSSPRPIPHIVDLHTVRAVPLRPMRDAAAPAPHPPPTDPAYGTDRCAIRPGQAHG